MPNNTENIYYVNIPVFVLNSVVSNGAKILYGHIKALTYNDDACCYASNQFLANKFPKCAQGTVSRWVRELKDAELIRSEIQMDYKRRIFVTTLVQAEEGDVDF